MTIKNFTYGALNKFITIIILGLVAYICYIGYLYRPRNQYVQQTPALTERLNYMAGEQLQWNITLCKVYDIKFFGTAKLENQTTGKQIDIDIVDTKSTIPAGECKEVSPYFIIPDTAKDYPGIYRVHRLIYPQDSKKNIKTFEYFTNEFTIN